MMKIFIVSLQRSTERRKSIERQFRHLGLDYTMIDAVDGLNLSPDEVREICHPDYFEKYKRSAWLTEGVVAAAMSHKIAYQRILDEGHDYALILEDDVLLAPEFPKTLEALRPHFKPDRIISLFCQASIPGSKILLKDKGKIPVTPWHNLYELQSLTYMGSAAGFIISRQAAERYRDIQTPIRFCPDWWKEFYKKHCYSEFRLLYPLILKPGEFTSTINYRKDHLMVNQLHQSLGKNNIIRRFVDAIRKKRLDARTEYRIV